VPNAGHGRTVLVANPGADQYGSDRMLLEAVSALVGSGWRPVVTMPGPGPLVDLVLERGGRVELCPTPVLRRTDLSPRGLVRLAGASARGLVAGNRLINRVRPVAIYVNTVTIPGWLVLARLRRIPAMCHVHEAEDAAPAPQRIALGLPLFLARQIVANSQYSRRVLLADLGRLARRTVVILNGVEGPPQVLPARPELAAPVRLVYVGRLSVRKGVDLLVDALARVNERGIAAELEIVGAVFPGYEWYEEQLREQVASAGLTDLVRFAGFQTDTWSRVAAADIACVPSRIEPFGNTAVEAVLSARPVVVSSVPGLVEATSGFGSARTFAHDDALALADALEETIGAWVQVREQALEDAASAAVRYAPAAFRSQLAVAIGAMVDRGDGRTV